MFGNDSLPSVIYRYGAKAPVEGGEAVRRQLSAAHRYRNVLVEIEHRRRECVAAAVRQASPNLDRLLGRVEQLTKEMATIRAAIKQTNQRTRKRTRGTPEQRAQIAAIGAELKMIRAEIKDAKAAAYGTDDAKASLKAIDEQANRKVKEARAASGLYWGTYLAIEQSASQFRRGKTPPKFQRWTGEGRLAVQIQGGMTADEAFACKDNRFRIEPLPVDAFLAGSPARTRRTIAHLRVGSDGRSPVWASVPVTLHRPIPGGAVIKWVYLTKRRVACHDEWSLCLVLSDGEGWAKGDLSETGSVGIDVGWRLLESGVRVAYWVGSDGDYGQVVIPLAAIGRWQKADDLRSIRDQRFNVIQDQMCDWLAGRDGLPDWMIERTATLRQWRSTARLAALAIHWRNNRFEGDEAMFALVEAWRQKDKHLYEWEVNQRRKAIAWRDDLYSGVAAMLRRKYRVARIEDTNWRTIQQNAHPEEDGNAQTKHYMRIAAPGRFLQAIKISGMAVETVPAKHTTQRCHACGAIVGFDAKANVWATCPGCDARWDQDDNAARNLLASGGVPQQSPVPLEC